MLIAPDSFTGTLSAQQAADAIAAGWLRSAPDDVIVCQPLADGGPGMLDVLLDTLGGRLLAQTVTGPLGEQVPATLLLTPDGSAYLESAQACGLDLVPLSRRDPGRTTTRGVGELIGAAVDAGARRIVVGLGGSGTNDGGSGALAALGAGPADLLGAGGAALALLSGPVDLRPARDRLGDVELIVASDVDHRLLGPNGATAVFAPQKGASRAQVAVLEEALSTWARQTDPRLVGSPGSGAAGGLGFGLMLLGGRRQSGSRLVASAVGLDRHISTADLVVTGEGSFDHQSLGGKVVAGVAHAAMAHGRPVVVLAGRVELGRREMQALGVESAYAVLDSATTPAPGQPAMLPEHPAAALEALAARVARTWSPRR